MISDHTFDKWIKNMVHRLSRALFCYHRKDEILSFMKSSRSIVWMELEIIMLSEISQTQKDKYSMAICGN
jgi:hypothetical protein